ncbi:MSCRAMM family adhesin SdrC [Halomicroarcula sp. F13]|uniref:MSCRAMM family adhesin SdrC n=1 Tax=Haloarcula rubra TaxID=2487747 RepID=A0AAW4PXB9_9EURY|nr:MSCRAMM family adhesin SdrC [Halomicroarcula rubra]MBX0325683.1 MSCRAMM family adhesin SdrC [Halomicroarcula rubra]
MSENGDNASDTADQEPDADADTTDDEEVTPDQQLAEIWTKYETELRDLDGGQGTRKAIEMIEEMSAIQADVEVNGSDSGDRIELIIEGYVNQIADRKSYLTRTSLKEIWEEEVSRAKSAASVDDELPTQFCPLIRETLESVEKKVTRDSDSSEAEYTLAFDDGRDTNFSVPRGSLFSEKKFWEAYTSASGQYPLRPDLEDAEWGNFIGSVIEPLEETTWEDGPRTTAFYQLENLVASSVAYGTLSDAVEHGGVYVDDEPPNHTEVWVLREDIARILQTHDISDRALQIEISSRDAHAAAARNDPDDEDSTGGGESVSYSTHVNGLWQTFWQLDADSFDEPDAYVEDPDDRRDREDAAIDAATGTNTTGDSNEASSDSVDEDSNDDGESNDDDNDNEVDHTPGEGHSSEAHDEDERRDDAVGRSADDQSEDVGDTIRPTETGDGECTDRIDETDNDSNDDYGITGRYGPGSDEEDGNGGESDA